MPTESLPVRATFPDYPDTTHPIGVKASGVFVNGGTLILVYRSLVRVAGRVVWSLRFPGFTLAMDPHPKFDPTVMLPDREGREGHYYSVLFAVAAGCLTDGDHVAEVTRHGTHGIDYAGTIDLIALEFLSPVTSN